MVKMNRADRKERRRLMALAASGSEGRLVEVAELFGVSTNCVYKACVEHGVYHHREWQKRKPGKMWVILAALLKGNRTQQQIADQVGCSRQLVSLTVKYAGESGIELPGGYRRQKRVAEVAR